MKDIKEYLEKQLILSHELNTILKKLDVLETKEKEFNYEDTKDLRSKLDNINNENINSVDDRISLLKNKLNEILSNPEIKKNADVFYPAYSLYKKLISLSSDLNSLEKKINKCYKANHSLGRSFPLQEKTFNNLSKENIIHNDNETNSSLEQHEDKTEYTVNQEFSSQEETIPLNENINNNIEDKPLEIKENSDRKLEFKFGTNILNIIGAILILISMITFGRYVYTNYMNDLIKGISLFVLSGCVLFCGEKIFKKKLPKFASGICALGIGGFYVSVIINYLVLDTINSVVAIILTLIITSISLYLSYRDSSNIVRLIGLLGAYMCMFPMNNLYGITSYITISILIIISIANGCFPIKNRIFLIYSSIINVAFCELIMAADFLEEPALKIYLIAALIINNLMYMKLLKEDDSRYYAVSLISSLSLIALILAKGDLILRILCLLVSIASYYISKNKLKLIHLTNSGITLVSLLLIYSEDLGILFTVLYIMLMAITLICQMKYEKNIFLQVYFIGLILLGMWLFIIGDVLKNFLYGVAFATIIWFLSDKYKNNWLFIMFKHIYLALIIAIIICIQKPFENEFDIYLSCAISIVYLLLTNNISKLKHDMIKQSNFIIMVLTFFICSIIGLDDILNCLISLVLGSVLIVLFTSEKYIDSKSVLEHKIIIYSIYSTYGICALFISSDFNNTISNILLSILLMAAAFINVWIGFKFNTVTVRRYGLILSLIVCAKLLIVDFYSFEFLLKSLLFLVVGILALAISYIYSKLEHELKNRE